MPNYYLGCPLWSNPAWVGNIFKAGSKSRDFLAQYAALFNTVEGNTTFYAVPKPETVQRWRDATPTSFRFCFKFPRTISHDARLHHAARETNEFLQRISPLQDRLGPIFLQLPAAFGPDNLAKLWTYLDELPDDFDYAVEVRHIDFFSKGEAEKSFNRGLYERGIDRVVFDSRALFSSQAGDADSLEAQRKKPRLPVRAIAVGPRPLVRFIGHTKLAANQPYLEPWQDKLKSWINEGRTPYFFAHTPTNHNAPELARSFHQQLRERLPLLPVLADRPVQAPEQLALL